MPKTPSYRKRSGYDQAIVTLTDRATKRRRDYWLGEYNGTNREIEPKRAAGERYTTPSFYVAIRRACDRAFPAPPPLGRRDGETIAAWKKRLTPKQQIELAAWQKAHRWHPHQLRHNAATEIRRAFGLEAAQLALGHSSAQVTDAVYAERDMSKVAEIMRRVG